MIRLDDVTITFDQRKLFDGYDLSIEKNEKVLLKAPSGRGKSTLVKAMLGFVRLESGDIYIKDKKMSSKNINEIRRSMAYVSQDVDIQADDMMTYIDEVFNFKLNKDLRYVETEVDYLLDLLDLDKRLMNKPTKELSGGERQRMGLLVAFLLKRDIMLLDEVTSGLDEALKEKVYKYIMDSKTTCVIISHDQIWHNDSIRQVVL